MGKTITVPVLSFGAIMDAINAAVPGDTVLLGEGSVDIEDHIGLTGIALLAQGKDKTQFKMKPETAIWIGDDARFGLLELYKDQADSGQRFVAPVGQRCRADHLRIVNKTGQIANGFFVDGRSFGKHPSGVADHNELYDARYMTFGPGDGNWSMPSTIGTPDQAGVFVFENNWSKHTFFSNAVDMMLDARIVFRRNIVIGSTLECHSNQGARNGRSWEFYENIIDLDNGSNPGTWTGMFIRGGTGVVYSNVFRNVPAGTACIKIDNHFKGPYPMKDQIGRGQDLAGGGQLLEPACFWNNKLEDGTPVLAQVVNGCEDLIQLNRDYFDVPRVGYTPSPYPYPLVGTAEPTPNPGEPAPLPPEPPPPNAAPTVTMILRNPATGKVILEGETVTIKNVKVELAGNDDVGTTRIELWIGKLPTPVKEAETMTLSYAWNTAPYKGSEVELRGVVRDAAGLTGEVRRKVLVKK